MDKDELHKIAAIACALLLLTTAVAVAQQRIRLWEGTSVHARSVTLEAFLPNNDGHPTPAVIVCPGGSYCWHYRETEGYEV